MSPLTQRPSLPIRREYFPRHILPRLCLVPLAANDCFKGKSSLRQDEDGPPGETTSEKETARKWTMGILKRKKSGGSVQREQIYILLNRSTIRGFRGSSSAEKGSECKKKRKKKNQVLDVS